MKRAVLFLAAISAICSIASAASATNIEKAKQVLTVDDCVRIAIKAAPELGESRADIDFTASKLAEAKSYRYPQIEIMSLFGPAPQARKEDLLATDKQLKFTELTWFTSANASLIQPLYTFGKISENMKAATHGIEVDRARQQQRANEVALKAKEYYYGLMLARELKELVIEILENLTNARKTANKLLEQESSSVEEIDLYKLDAFTGETTKYLEEALKGEALAMAALRTRLALPPDTQIEIANERLSYEEEPVTPYEVYLERARSKRPEFRQIEEGVKARTALVEASKANYYPDIFLGGLFSWSYAEERDRIKNPYITDSFKHLQGGVALGLRWKLDFGITGSKVAAEQAQLNRLLSTKEFADANIPLQIRKFHLDLKEAENSIGATRQAFTNAKKWAVTSLANFDFGVGPAKDIFEALQAYARMRASYFQSIYNYRIAKANLEYAVGEQPVTSTGN